MALTLLPILNGLDYHLDSILRAVSILLVPSTVITQVFSSSQHTSARLRRQARRSGRHRPRPCRPLTHRRHLVIHRRRGRPPRSSYRHNEVVDTLQVDYTQLKPPDPHFSGACVVTGATSSVVGIAQAQVYYHESGRPFQLAHSPRRFRFGNGTQNSLGTIELRIPTSIGSVIRRRVDIVSADATLLLGLELMRDREFVIDLSAMAIHQRTQALSLDLSFEV